MSDRSEFCSKKAITIEWLGSLIGGGVELSLSRTGVLPSELNLTVLTKAEHFAATFLRLGASLSEAGYEEDQFATHLALDAALRLVACRWLDRFGQRR